MRFCDSGSRLFSDCYGTLGHSSHLNERTRASSHLAEAKQQSKAVSLSFWPFPLQMAFAYFIAFVAASNAFRDASKAFVDALNCSSSDN
jgi:hypothetical protein